jgi:hypothetical protein
LPNDLVKFYLFRINTQQALGWAKKYAARVQSPAAAAAVIIIPFFVFRPS